MTHDVLAGGLDMLEISSGVVFGLDDSIPDPPRGRLSPRAAIEEAIVGSLQRQPCGVAFSGGRDSSAVLGAATSVARKLQLPDPIPVTLRFPGVVSTEESAYQESVVRHLGLKDWIRLEPADTLDILGDLATDLTLRHGLMYPGNIHVLVPMFEAVRGGALLTGVGGDEVLGGHRNHAFVAMLTGQRRPNRRLVRSLAKRYVAPGRIRNQMSDQLFEIFPWLLPSARSEVVEHMVQDLSCDPLFADRYLVSTTHRMRYLRRSQNDTSRLGEDFDVVTSNPLIDPAFIGAIADDVGRRGLATRTEMMQRFFADLLPTEVIERTSKATFDDVLWTSSTREVAMNLPLEHLAKTIDPEILRTMWESDDLKGNTVLMAKYLKGDQTIRARESRAGGDSDQRVDTKDAV